MSSQNRVAYDVYDVFTDTPYGGNQLAIVHDAQSLPEDALQQIAREFNFSETTFILTPADPSNRARVRIFTPTQEVPFAGHPTIGTAVALAARSQSGPMVLELGIGPIACNVTGNTATFVTTAPLEVLGEPDIAITARALSLSSDHIKVDHHPPTQASLGLPFAFVELSDREALRACKPVTAVFEEAAERFPTTMDFAIFAYVRHGTQIDARMFAPLDNIPEDPATGSACATLAAFLSRLAGEALSFSITQGEDMGRLSRIKARALAGSETQIEVSGTAIQTMEGHLVR